ncbi:hypothetical protein [Parasedimentitalea huanghaiensis]|uniref:Uncharacterized protein n=1 Tax=Parasedimentitalea huanghaiensis TaxID=2682100 RepID=A0A6L6WDR5_9RHOB|nr:hypothetical protein [Zongyanglinia huanghaiensis]MVO15844.1 hypothetical protein [Zongyanglinia huanghaiensis]
MKFSQFLLSIAQLRCPNCSSLQEPYDLTKTAGWMAEDEGDHVPFIACNKCCKKLRLADRHGARWAFQFVFVGGSLLGLAVVGFLGLQLSEPSLSIMEIAVLTVLWLAFGAVLFSFSMRYLKVEIVE